MKLSGLQKGSLGELRRRIRLWRSELPQARPGIEPGSFVVARILGNDLYPRHRSGTMLANLRFILENEPKPANTVRLFVVNRLFDGKQEIEAVRLIEAAGDEALVIPFKADEFANLGWNLGGLSGREFVERREFLALDPEQQNLMRIWAASPKVAYAMNINGARNLALAAGRSRAEWTAVLDGGCVFTEESLRLFAGTCRSAPFAPHVVIPMERIEDNRQYGERQPSLTGSEEPQLAFHASTSIEFDERFIYGIRDKTVLLKSLGVPPWGSWRAIAWLPDDDLGLKDRHFFKYSEGGVFRLSSGGSGLEREKAQKQRYRMRNQSILRSIRELCEVYGTRHPELADVILGPRTQEDEG